MLHHRFVITRNLCTSAYVYKQKSRILKKNRVSLSIQNNVTVSKDCVNGQDITASYELTYTTDSSTPIATCIVNGTECSNGTCHYELHSNTADSRCQPQVSQFTGSVNVSLTARNIVGRSIAVSRRISEFSEA